MIDLLVAYGLQGQLLGEYREDGTPLREYLHADGAPLMMVHYTADEAALYWYHTDHLGTPQALTDRHGQIAWQAQYDPFGKVVLLVNSVTQPLRFPGQYFDEETGRHYNFLCPAGLFIRLLPDTLTHLFLLVTQDNESRNSGRRRAHGAHPD